MLLTNKEKNLQDKNLQEFTRTSKRFIKTRSLLVPIYLTLPFRAICIQCMQISVLETLCFCWKYRQNCTTPPL